MDELKKEFWKGLGFCSLSLISGWILNISIFALLIFSALAIGIFLKLHEISILLQDKKPIIKKNSGKNG